MNNKDRPKIPTQIENKVFLKAEEAIASFLLLSSKEIAKLGQQRITVKSYKVGQPPLFVELSIPCLTLSVQPLVNIKDIKGYFTLQGAQQRNSLSESNQ